ncbi:dephospho-CoA kinase [Legionella waltersii]|uniref:Dephospho-CoA kinase n=1 Tax=Legionella waltersii TaxID=66969 RepID=A0A0W1A187_9GAMM|nr:dephospho-CoA kinase [Legionella waltersii]KTD75127.1 dephospho-CoA kinase [Legionella waltersii]SNV04930.1 dephospho-CoA kinase [Legionella waltersii]
MVYSVGLTGNIASGKSTVAHLFSKLGVQVINADNIARELTAKNSPIYLQIVSHFGKSILDQSDHLNRPKLREIIFKDLKQKEWLEQLLHPAIRIKMQQEVSKTNSAYCLIEIPLLTSKDDYPYLNRILVVTAPIETQVMRVVTRDNCSKQHALDILASQPSLSSRLALADDVLINDNTIQALKSKVEKLHHRYLQESSLS